MLPTLFASQLSRRHVLAAGAGLVAAPRGVLSQDAEDAQADFLFVQTATGMAFDADRNRLTLNGVSPVTLFFSDQPERVADDMAIAAFVPFWSEGVHCLLELTRG